MSKPTVKELFDAYHAAISCLDKMYYKQELLKQANNGSQEANRYIELINKR